MKKILCALLSCMLIFVIAGCSQQENVAPDNTETEPSVTVENAEESVPTQEPSSSEESPASSEETESNPETEGSNILIAYFSWSGNTEQVAEVIQTQTGGDVFEIIPTEPYPDDFDETADRWHEERDSNARPAINGQVENMEDYDVIFLGYPIWSSDLPAVNRTFLEQYDFTGKTIIPFCTHGGSSFGNSVNRIEELAPGAEILEGYETYGRNVDGCTGEVTEWISGLGLEQS